MRRSSKAELQMLREYAWLMMPMDICFFCKERLLIRPDAMTFGHRRHPPISIKISVHHFDHNREHNLMPNLRVAHRKCHQKYHAEVNSGVRSKPLSSDS